jgi:hypothetical protein
MTGGKLLRLERMIPAYGIIVKHIFPYACLFRNFVRGLRKFSYLQLSGGELQFSADICILCKTIKSAKLGDCQD